MITTSHKSGARPARILAGAWRSTTHFRPVLVLVVVLFIVFSVTQPIFLHQQNLENLLTGVAIIWMVAIGMTYATLVGGFDLSPGAVAALCGILIGKMIDTYHAPAGVAVVCAIVLGALIGGFVNGVLIGYFGLPPFVVTLGTMTALTGVVNLWSNTQTQLVTAPLINKLGVEKTWSLPTPIWLMLGLMAVAMYVQHRTYFGRDMYAVGGSVTAAQLSGIRVQRTLVIVYAIVGACSALGGVIAVGRIGAASPNVDVSLPLQAAAGVLIGGTALSGGSGGLGGTVLGVLFIGELQNGLSLAGVQSFWQQVVTGVILLLAVLGERLSTSIRGATTAVARYLGRGRPGPQNTVRAVALVGVPEASEVEVG